MAIYGRKLNPGEKNPTEVMSYDTVHSRTMRAQIVDVNPDDGYVIMDYNGLPAGGKYATVMPLWMSFPEVGGHAWGRFMPQRSDIVKVGFDHDNRPHIVGYDIIAGKSSVADGQSGWPQLNALHARAKADPNAKVIVSKNGAERKVSIAKYGQFTPLNPGEYDFMSSGGAYIHGNNRGRLYMAGGSVSVSLTKNDLSLNSISQYWSHRADDCTFRFGQVRRTGTNGLDGPVASDPNGELKEFRVSLKASAPTAMSVADLHIGNVVTDLGTVETGPTGAPLRYMQASYSDAGVRVQRTIADIVGNYQVEANSSVVIQSPSIKFEGLLGAPPAIHPLLLTQVYRAAEDAAISGLASQIATLATTVSGLASALAVLLTPAVTGPFVTVAGAVAVAAPNIASAFTGGGQSYLSTVVKTG